MLIMRICATKISFLPILVAVLLATAILGCAPSMTKKSRYQLSNQQIGTAFVAVVALIAVGGSGYSYSSAD
jgi:hypothetical protein